MFLNIRNMTSTVLFNVGTCNNDKMRALEWLEWRGRAESDHIQILCSVVSNVRFVLRGVDSHQCILSKGRRIKYFEKVLSAAGTSRRRLTGCKACWGRRLGVCHHPGPEAVEDVESSG